MTDDFKHLIVRELESMVRQERGRRRESAHSYRAVTLSGSSVTWLAVNLVDDCTWPAKLVRGFPWNCALWWKLQCLAIGETGVRRERLVGNRANHLWHGFPVSMRRIVGQAEVGSHQDYKNREKKEIELHAATSCSRSSTRTAWCFFRNCSTSSTSKAALSSSSTSAKRSLVTRGSSSVGRRPGQRRLTPKNARTVLMPANSTITSNVIGTKAGSEFQGFLRR